jgi:hypothetical protein
MQHSTIPASNVINDSVPTIKNIDSSCESNCGSNIEPNNDVDVMTSKIEKPRRKVPFWSENPNILFHSKYFMEFFPVENMSYEQKLNAITRTVLIFTLIGISITRSFRTLIIGVITMIAIFSLFYYHQKEITKKNDKKNSQILKENFEGNTDVVNDLFKLNDTPIPNSDKLFEEPSASNPFGNVLVTDYDYNPEKKPAPPAFNKQVNTSILSQAKQFITDANPDHPDIADKLFNDMGSQLVFEQSLRPFSSNPATTIPNDQAAFAEFCYGDMVSCKEGNKFACARNLSRYTNI